MNSVVNSSQRVKSLAVGGASLALGVAAWWALAAFSSIPSYVLPTPSAVVARGVELWGTGSLQVHIAQTLAEVGQGTAIGVSIGLVLAILCARVPRIEKLLMPIIVVLQVTPKISIAPIIVLWLGLGIGSKVTLVALVTFYPVLINMLARLKSVPTTLDDLSKILNMGAIRRAFVIDFPFSLPALAAGLRIGVLQAVTAAVIGEFIGAQAGLGYLEKQAQDNDDIRLVLVSLLLLCLIGWALYSIVGLVEKWITRRFGG